MADFTGIEWCDATLNLWWGCTKVSQGCKFCYAEELSDQRYKKGAWGPGGQRTEVKSWRATLNKVSKRAKAEGRRLRVFCQSMSDTFEGPDTCGGVESENWKLIRYMQDRLFEAIWYHRELDFLILTKRPENALKYFKTQSQPGYENTITPNLWIGTSVEDQATADARIPHLLQIPAAVRFLSCEPLLGDVDITPWLWGKEPPCDRFPKDIDCECGWKTRKLNGLTSVDWVICGGESGPNARPMNPEWARSLRDQCQAAGVPFFFKQWGEWVPGNHSAGGDLYDFAWKAESGFFDYCGRWNKGGPNAFRQTMSKVGKKAAGSVLDGREWKEFPRAEGVQA